MVDDPKLVFFWVAAHSLRFSPKDSDLLFLTRSTSFTLSHKPVSNFNMFAKPRPKKNLLPPPSKKRKIVHSIAEISFDNDARQEYLTGFHKRKQQRIKRAQEEAATRAREEKLETRKQVRHLPWKEMDHANH